MKFLRPFMPPRGLAARPAQLKPQRFKFRKPCQRIPAPAAEGAKFDMACIIHIPRTLPEFTKQQFQYPQFQCSHGGVIDQPFVARRGDLRLEFWIGDGGTCFGASRDIVDSFNVDVNSVEKKPRRRGIRTRLVWSAKMPGV